MAETVNIQVLIDAAKSAKTIDDLEKSVDDLNEVLGAVGENSKEFKQLSKAVDDAENSMVKLALETDETSATVGQLEKNVEVLTNKLKTVDRGTKEFNELKGKLIETSRELKNVELSLEALDTEQVAGELGSVAGAVGDVTTSFILLGGESNETLEEIASRVETAIGVAIGFKGAVEGIQSGLKLYRNFAKQLKTNGVLLKAQAIATSLYSKAQAIASKVIGTSTIALKGFRTALISTGIGAIVVALGALIANFDKLKVALGGATEAQKLQSEVSDKAIENAAEELSAIDELTNTINKEGITRKERNLAIEKLQEEYPDLLKNIDLERATNEDLNSSLEEYNRLVILRAEAEAAAEIRAENFKEILKLQADAQNETNKSFTSWAASLSLGADQQKIANVQTKIAITELEEQTKKVDNLTASKKEEIAEIEKKLGLDKATKEAEKEAEKAAKKAEAAAAEAARKAKAAAEKRKQQKIKDAADEVKRLEDVATLEEELFQKGLTNLEDQEARKLTIQFEAQRKRITTLVKDDEKLKALLKTNEEQFFRDLEAIEKKFSDLDKAKQQELLNNAKDTNLALLLLDQQLQLEKLADTKENAKERELIEARILQVRIKQIQTASAKELQDQKLTAKEREKIEKDTELQILKIRNEGRDKDLAADKAANASKEDERKKLKEALVALGFETAQAVADASFEIAQQNADRESEKIISAVESTFTKETELLAAKVDQGLITQREADRLTAEQERVKNKALAVEAKRAFEDNKKRQRNQAVINGALAFTNALATTQPLVPLGLIAAAGTIISTGVQLSKIDSAKFAKGGILSGPSHSQGGIKTRHGELEGGEAVINKKSTSMFRSQLSKINQAGGGVKFAQGGILGNSPGGGSAQNTDDLSKVLTKLSDNLAKPIRSFVVEEDVTETQKRVENLESNADL